MRKATSVVVSAVLAAIVMAVLVLTAAAAGGRRDSTVVEPVPLTTPTYDPSDPSRVPGGGLEWG